MFIREVPQRLSDGRTVVYLQVVESFRDEDKAPRTRILASLGRVPGDGLRRLRELQRSATELLQRHDERAPVAAPLPTFALAELVEIVEHALSGHVLRDLWARLDLGEVVTELAHERHLRPDLARDVLDVVTGTLVPTGTPPVARCAWRTAAGIDRELTDLLATSIARFVRHLLGGLQDVLGPGDATLLVHADAGRQRLVVVGPHGLPMLVVARGAHGTSATDLVAALRAVHPGRLVVSVAAAPQAWSGGSAPGIARLDVLPGGQVPTGVSASVLTAPGRYAEVGPGLGAKEVRDVALPGTRLILVRTPTDRRVMVTDDLVTPVPVLVAAWGSATATLEAAATLPDDRVAAWGLATLLRGVAERLAGRPWAPILEVLGRHRAVVVRHGAIVSLVHEAPSDEASALLEALGVPPPMSAPIP